MCTCTVITWDTSTYVNGDYTDPVFIKDSDINIRGNIVIELCREIDKLWIGEALGAQKFHQVWKICIDCLWFDCEWKLCQCL